MSKKKIEAAMEEFVSWLPNYEPQQQRELVDIVGRMLASVRGGDRFEDLGFEPYDVVSWKELDMISNIFSAVDDSFDVEQAAEMLFPDEEEDDEDDD